MTTTVIANSVSEQPRYSVKVGGRWWPDMIGTEDSAGSSESYAGIIGQPIEDITIGDGYKYSVRGKRNKWVDGDKYDQSANLSKGGPVTGIKIEGNVIYAVHVKGGSWLPSVHGGEIISAGVPIDAIWIESVE